MLVCFPLYIHVCLPRSKFCHAWHPSWAYACQSLGPLACVVASIPLVVCLDVIACETHLRDISVLDTHLSLLCAIMLCLPWLFCATCWAFFASLHFYTFAYMFMHESLLACVIKPNSYYLIRVHTHLWYTTPRVPFRNFAWWHVCHPYSNPMELWTPNPNLHLSS